VGRRTVAEGHEAGVHAWDHRRWQDSLQRMRSTTVCHHLDRGREAFAQIFGTLPRTFAAPAWFSSDVALLHQEEFGLAFSSDCRGSEPFLPEVAGRVLRTPQVPTTLPTLDEALGDRFETATDYFDAMLAEALLATWPALFCWLTPGRRKVPT